MLKNHRQINTPMPPLPLTHKSIKSLICHVASPKDLGNPIIAQKLFSLLKLGLMVILAYKLRENFYSYVDSKHRATGITAKNIQSVLFGSPNNENAAPLISIRQRKYIQSSMYSLNQGSPVEDSDYSYLFPQLTSKFLVQNFSQLEEGESLNYFNGGDGLSGRSLETKIAFNQSVEAERLHTKFAN